MTVINLTQHPATAEQLADGVVDLPTPERRAHLQSLLTFAAIPSHADVVQRAQMIARLAAPAAFCGHPEQCSCESYLEAMIGGAPYLMAPLEEALRDVGVSPLYAYTERVSAEERQPDGSVRKVNVFRHAGWVPA